MSTTAHGFQKSCHNYCLHFAQMFTMTFSANFVGWSTTCQQQQTSQWSRKNNVTTWFKFMRSIIAQFYIRLVSSSPTAFPHVMADQQMGDAEILEAFKAMGPLLMKEPYIRDKQDEKEPKKPKRHHVPEAHQTVPEVATLVLLMGSMLLKMDSEQQFMRKQDSFVFFLQTATPALLPQLMTRASEWHQMMKQKATQASEDTPYVPLRAVLFRDLATMLDDRVQQLSKETPQDPLWSTARAHGLITEEGQFPFQKWCTHQKALKVTKQDYIPMQRMLKYTDQLKTISRDHSAIMKFHALRQAEEQTTVPWILQTGVRYDELQFLLEALQGSTVWGLIGAAMKPHTQVYSKQGLQLQNMLGKGKGKQTSPTHGKGRGKTNMR